MSLSLLYNKTCGTTPLGFQNCMRKGDQLLDRHRDIKRQSNRPGIAFCKQEFFSKPIFYGPTNRAYQCAGCLLSFICVIYAVKSAKNPYWVFKGFSYVTADLHVFIKQLQL